jgi:hypothetical protein
VIVSIVVPFGGSELIEVPLSHGGRTPSMMESRIFFLFQPKSICPIEGLLFTGSDLQAACVRTKEYGAAWRSPQLREVRSFSERLVKLSKQWYWRTELPENIDLVSDSELSIGILFRFLRESNRV